MRRTRLQVDELALIGDGGNLEASCDSKHLRAYAQSYFGQRPYSEQRPPLATSAATSRDRPVRALGLLTVGVEQALDSICVAEKHDTPHTVSCARPHARSALPL